MFTVGLFDLLLASCLGFPYYLSILELMSAAFTCAG